MKKRVCVVGAGPSGLVTTKELLNKGIDVKCFESQNGIGGAFRSIESGGRSYDSLELTVSNYFMAFSDYMPSHNQERRYWKVDEYREYLEEYAEKFSLYDCIFFSHKIVSANIRDDKIVVKVLNEFNEYSEVFDHIILCSGSNFTPNTPMFENQSVFKGEILHSKEYNNNRTFKGKEVVCIGLGESGADIVHEISQVTSCTVLVNENPNVVPRWINGFTNDAYTSHCFYAMKKKGIDAYMKLKSMYYLKYDKKLKDTDRLIQEWILDRKSFMGKFFTKNDVFIKDIVDGKVTLFKDSIESLTENGMLTKNKKEIKADIILCNTGYKSSFKEYDFGKWFLDPRKLFKQMIHPKYGDLISLIGWARPSQGGLPACSEMQARYISLLISKKKTLPNEIRMRETISEDSRYYEKLFSESENIKSLVCYNNFMTSMAKLIGCTPKLFYINDLTLSWKIFFGSQLSSLYRFPNPDSINVIKSLPIAYSIRRSVILLVFIIIFNPRSLIKWLFR